MGDKQTDTDGLNNKKWKNMKKMILVSLFAIGSAIAEPLPLHPVSATLLRDDAGEIVGFVQVDLAGLVNKKERTAREMKRLETAKRREGMSNTEIVADHFKNNWGKYTAAVVAAVAVDRVADANGWLWHERSNRSAGNDIIGDDTASAVTLNNIVEGNGNTINQNVVIQMPNGSGSGMTGNTGSGGVANIGE